MNFKQIIKDYFTFSRNERKGITILLILIFLFAIANKLIFYFETPAKIDTVLFDSAKHELGFLNDSLNKSLNLKRLFLFDPSTIDSVDLENLDLPDNVKGNLLKFRRQGGRLESNSDFRKIYGVNDEIYSRIKPFLQFKSEDKLPISKNTELKLFIFDPNKATDEQFNRLSLSDKQIATIRKYQSKGGVYRNKEDFFRMWGLTNHQKQVLADFIKIENPDKSVPAEEKVLKVDVLELNSVDSIQLKTLPGIGVKLSKRIIKYRDLLGGFYSLKQLLEVYGLKEQTLTMIEPRVTIDTSRIRKIDLNFMNANELARHPYLQKKLAQQIVRFRTKYGNIKNFSVLRDSMILNIDEYNRLKPYF